ncbi:MAG: TlpA disulfide reductase family protein [Pseudomonadota bacterium]
MLQRILALLILLLFSTAIHAAAPSVELRDLDGRPRNANEFIGHGKWTVVVAWAHDCLICKREIHEMAAFHVAHKDRDAIVLGVSIDGMDKLREAREFVADHKLPFVNLIAEPEQEVMMAFGGGPFIGTPTYYIYDPSGKIVARNVGPTSQHDVEKFIDGYNANP